MKRVTQQDIAEAAGYRLIVVDRSSSVQGENDFLDMALQRHIVKGVTAGAVKG